MTDTSVKAPSPAFALSECDESLFAASLLPASKLLPEEVVMRMLTSRVIEPSQAVEIARAHGMKGNVLRVILHAWGRPPLEVWRVLPDNIRRRRRSCKGCDRAR
jgi:hypothetical protein